MVVDMQKGFLYEKTAHIVPAVRRLCQKARECGVFTLFSKLINTGDSNFVRWLGWKRLIGDEEIAFEPSLQEFAKNVYPKRHYNSLTPEALGDLRERGIEKLILCGLQSDGCVLKTAIDAFENDIEPFVVGEATTTNLEPPLQEGTLAIIGHSIGKERIITLAEAVKMMESNAPIKP